MTQHAELPLFDLRRSRYRAAGDHRDCVGALCLFSAAVRGVPYRHGKPGTAPSATAGLTACVGTFRPHRRRRHLYDLRALSARFGRSANIFRPVQSGFASVRSFKIKSQGTGRETSQITPLSPLATRLFDLSGVSQTLRTRLFILFLTFGSEPRNLRSFSQLSRRLYFRLPPRHRHH